MIRQEGYGQIYGDMGGAAVGATIYKAARQNVTFAIAEIKEGEISFTRIDIPNGEEKEEGLPDNLDAIISKSIKLIDKGKKPETIARSCGISKELAEEICRMYLTHPGIDIQGIITRLQ